MNHEFPCGTRVLDFAGTLRARRNAEPYEFIAAPADLDDWFRQSGLRSLGAPAAEADLVAARDLREAVYTLAWHRLHDEPLPVAALASVNEVARTRTLDVALTQDALVRSGDVGQALSALAREAIEVLGGEDIMLLRECGRPECTQIYLDRSRGHRREWCSMASCGSRAKAAAYRARRRDAASA